MWTLLLIQVASANPDRVLGRVDDRLRDRSYATVEGEGPVRGRWRRRSGDIVGRVFPDGVFEQYTRRDAGTPEFTLWFSAAGTPIGRLEYSEGEPSAFTALSPDRAAIDVSSWQTVDTPLVTLRAPEPAQGEDNRLLWRVGDGRIELGALEPVDPMDPAFADQVAAGCGCDLLDRHTAWLDGKRGIRLLLDVPNGGPGERGELWAIPTDDAVLTVWATWPIGEPSAHATLRALVSQATWTDE